MYPQSVSDGVLRRLGTTNGTVKVIDVNPSGESDPRELTQFKSNIFFRADDGVKGDEVWMTDGSVGNASLVVDIMRGSDSSWPNNFFVFNDALFFSKLQIIPCHISRILTVINVICQS